MKIEDMVDLIAMYDMQVSADKIICLATGEDTISALEYAGNGLFGIYMRLEKMIERNCSYRIRNACIRDGLPAWAVILTNRELTAEDRAAVLLGVPSCRGWMLLSGYKCRTKYRLSGWQIWHDERGIPDGE